MDMYILSVLAVQNFICSSYYSTAGKFVKQGQMLRAKAQLEQLQSEIASVARKTGISSATKLALIAPSKDIFDDTIPVVEWWDAAILPHKQ